ncbi:MAG: hypothetical protein WCT77_09180 [Bacteroidota bacterium]
MPYPFLLFSPPTQKNCHSREGGNPSLFSKILETLVPTALRGNAVRTLCVTY